MDQKHAGCAASFPLTNQTAVEPDVVGRPHSYTENGRFTVDSDSPGAYPFFDLAARSNTGAGEDLLESLTCFAALMACATPDGLLTTVMLLVRGCMVRLGGFGCLAFGLRWRGAAPTRGCCFELFAFGLGRLLRSVTAGGATSVCAFALLAARPALLRASRTLRIWPRAAPTRRRSPHGCCGVASLASGFKRCILLYSAALRRVRFARFAQSASRGASLTALAGAAMRPARLAGFGEAGAWSASLAAFARSATWAAGLAGFGKAGSRSVSLAAFARSARIPGVG